jgi:hypothetical protein
MAYLTAEEFSQFRLTLVTSLRNDHHPRCKKEENECHYTKRTIGDTV